MSSNVVRNLAVILFFALVAWVSPGATQGAPTIHQMQHRSWTIRDGAPPDIWALAQTPDGFLWLGTGAGLFRFDGVDFERVVAANAEQYPSINITALFVSHSGDLWIGYNSGNVSRLRNGELTNFPRLNGNGAGLVSRFIQDADDNLWVATFGGLFRYDGSDWQHVGAERNFPDNSQVSWIETTSDGTLWVGDWNTIRFLRPGSPQFETIDVTTGRSVFIEHKPGELLVLDAHHGAFTLSIETSRPTRLPESLPDGSRLNPNYIFQDHNGVIWSTDIQLGGVHRLGDTDLARGVPADAFRSASVSFTLGDGLSSNIAVPILEDNDKNVWVGTNLGLDRFSASLFVSADILPATSALGYSSEFSSLGEYIADARTIYRIDKAQQAEFVARSESDISNLLVDRGGRLWVATSSGLYHVDNGKMVAADLPREVPDPDVQAIVEDTEGHLWALFQNGFIFHQTDDGWKPLIVPSGLEKAAPTFIYADPLGGVWSGFRDNGLLKVQGSEQTLFTARQGLDQDHIQVITRVGNWLMLGGGFGLSIHDGHRFYNISTQQLPAAIGISGIAAMEDGSIWLNTLSGVMRIQKQEMSKALNDSAYTPPYEIFTAKDGLPGVAEQDSPSQTMDISWDNKLWVTTNHGLAWFAPLGEVPAPPQVPVFIKQVLANGEPVEVQPFSHLRKGITNLSVTYSALNLTSPERTQFRYKLLGVDDQWIDAGVIRTAQYSNLSPGQYALEVIATADVDAWPKTGTQLVFSIPPTFLESRWFSALLVIVACLILFAIYAVRIQQVSVRIKTRLEERMAERERIARDLHDTLLQGFQGLVLHFQAVVSRLPANSGIQEELEKALDRADEVLAEGRDQVQNLRAPAEPQNLKAAFEEISTEMAKLFPTEFRVRADFGHHRLHPIAHEEIKRIGQEAIINAFRHSQASHIDIDLQCATKGLTLRIKDDGRGSSTGFLGRDGANGHFGVAGMRERADQLRSQLVFRTRRGVGTEVFLSVPASIAYPRRRSRFLNRLRMQLHSASMEKADD